MERWGEMNVATVKLFFMNRRPEYKNMTDKDYHQFKCKGVVLRVPDSLFDGDDPGRYELYSVRFEPYERWRKNEKPDDDHGGIGLTD